MRIKHDIAAQKLSLQAAMQDLARAREDVSLNVTLALPSGAAQQGARHAWPKAKSR